MDTNADVVLRAQLGQRIAAARKHKKMTQLELGVSAGVRQSSVANIEGGRFNMSIATFLAIARALGVTPDILLMSGAGEADAWTMVADLRAENEGLVKDNRALQIELVRLRRRLEARVGVEDGHA